MKEQIGNEEVRAMSEKFIRTLPQRPDKQGELDELMSLYAPSAWGVGLEGIEIKADNGNIVAGVFGPELFFNLNRSGFPEHSRLCLTKCLGLCDYQFYERVAGPALQRAAVLSKVFIALASPFDQLAWMQARATARAAKASGAFVLLVAAKRDVYFRDQDVFQEAIADIDPDDTHCVLQAEVVDPLLFLEAFAWTLVPSLARQDMADIRQLLEEHNHAVVLHVVVSKKYTLSRAVSRGVDCDRIGCDDINEIAGVIVLLDNRDYPESTAEELVAETTAVLSGLSVHVVVDKLTDGEAHPETCSLHNYHDFFMIALLDQAML